ncbi:hypothetical protein B795N_14880 [Marinilactibacillus psychrotolerans]|uniref:DUF3847 domain-containing protein n=1 Tax=Marinilactibacillus psychrotolerans TaxID=191770 RepID=UPI001C7CB7C1|nr:DUF3847 domain-containing protein [Marinilactibacillus psychrotolerans]GEQ33606.1 hypothetical protein B795N_14880 [Marinilactibacillus psychrotolerans]
MDFNVKKTTQEINRGNRLDILQSDRLRKERTHRLIQKGALLEKYFDIKHLSIDDTEKLLKKLSPIIEKARENQKK